MRILLIAAAVLALTAVSAQAQMGGGRRQPGNDAPKADNKPKVDEKAYKAALDRIPEPKQKYDPWSGARPSEPAKKPN
ncbi:hypothetical protein QA641_18175 [Bradyrhizobium sp. CB1650]|uniref:hypothetical protein n=1 Tax=Bradyrhizobium sp. CB1650 TaxID=3039153 RepID=UPI002435C47E|nr:hypothetical protein [Bradyrhizobium sp. CB1650]WGD55636.1 hypothetical protein QA641_18175 [Bradyrhizobium sp. CB1650]